MKNKKIIPFLLLSSFIFSCSSNNEDKKDDENNLVDTYADKSDLPYVSSLDFRKKSDWKGKWIWLSSSTSDSYVAFRKNISLDDTPSSVKISISADSKYYMWINDELVVVDGSLKRGPTYYDSYYEEIDVTKYFKKGENLIAIMVNYFGRDGNASLDSGNGGLLLDINIDGEIIGSNTSFKVKRLQEYRNLKYLRDDYPDHATSGFLAEQNVYYDARLKNEDFYKLSYDDSSWDNATLIANPGSLPYGDLYLSEVPQFKFSEVKEMDDTNSVLNTKFTKDTTVSFKIPEGNIQFMPYFELESDEEGKILTFYTDTYYAGNNQPTLMDDYVTIKGEQTYQQYPRRSGQIFYIDVKEGITLKKVGYIKTGYNTENINDFSCSESDLNTLFEKAENTLNICMRDTYMDCPERERSPYSGDGANQMLESLYDQDENALKLIKNTMLSLLGWTKDDNVMPSRWPSEKPTEIPVQNLAYITTAYEYYLHSGDKETMSLLYPLFVDYLSLYTIKDNGTLNFREGSFYWVDWGTNIDEEVIENAFYYMALNATKNLGNDLNLTYNSSFLNERIERIKEGFETFKTSKGYTSNETSIGYDDRANALAVVSGLYDTSLKDVLVDVLTTETRSSTYMERYALTALIKLDKVDKAIERMKSRYKEMIEDDTCSTLWEEWTKENGSINHGWTGTPIIVLSKYIAGISPTSSKFDTYEIKPNFVFDSLSTNVNTPYGDIKVSWTKENDKTILNIYGNGKDGTIYIPSSFSNIEISPNDNTIEKLETNVYKFSGTSYTLTLS